MNKIKLYIDGPNLEELKNLNHNEIDGYTFNPSLFKKNGATNYINHSKEILNLCKNKPVSLEVIADTEHEMIEQAEMLNDLGDNIFIKIPICYTNGDTTEKVISSLINKNFKLNITAIFLIEQIENLIKIIKDQDNLILSVFVGRIFDAGKDGENIMKKINELVHNKSSCKTLWASTRMVFDLIKAQRIGTDIITMQFDQIKKTKKFNYDLKQYSMDTVKQFFDDAKSSGFEIK
tara:strand:+ start:1217 stop:1918 length:702 start_codon:yes stop_codon:yes gene_type:complete